MGDAYILRQAMKLLRGRIARGDFILNEQAVLRFQRLIADVESCEDHNHCRKIPAADVWELVS